MTFRSSFRFASASLALAALVISPLGCASWGAGVHVGGGQSSVGHGHDGGHSSHPLGGPPGQMKKHGKKYKGYDDSGISVSVEGTIKP